MAKKKKTAEEQHVELEGVKYYTKDFNQEQVAFYNHLIDLSNKERNMAFNLQQIQGGREHFTSLLSVSLKNGKAESD
jgi:hypothetical protein